MDEYELARCIKLYHKAVYRAAYSVLRNAADADDACQEAFIKLYGTKTVFESEENRKAWLLRVAINIAKNMAKSPARSRCDELDDNLPCFDNSEYELMEAVAALPPKYRAVIHLHYFEGYSVKEIARIIGTPVSTATTRLARAREKLKKQMTSESGEYISKEGHAV